MLLCIEGTDRDTMKLMDIEAIVLSGGASRRMGQDKASLMVGGESVLARTVRLLEGCVSKVTVLGPQGIPDKEPRLGPLAALAQFRPTSKYVFVASCDMPRFEPTIVGVLRAKCEARDAAIPVIGGHMQPLCALYRASSFSRAADCVAAGSFKVRKWVEAIDAVGLPESELILAGIDPLCLTGANSPAEWASLLNEGNF